MSAFIIPIGETLLEEKTCRQCSAIYSITNTDWEFYEKVSPVFHGKKYTIPAPTRCPNCRAKNILATRNERNLYRRQCDATGKDIISIHSPDKTFKVYDQNYWWSDHWNSLQYGRDVDFSRPFSQQFIELFQSVPKVSLNAPMSQNSEFTNQCQGNKSCYMLFCSGGNEDCYYGMWNQESKDCMDCLYVEFSEHCYSVSNAKRCYHCILSKNLEGCSHISWSRDLINCSDCLFCVNLQQKQYCILNKQYTKEEYFVEKERLKSDTAYFTDAQKAFDALSLESPVKSYQWHGNELFSGDYIENSHDALFAFNCRDNEISRYCRDSWRVESSYDLIETLSMTCCLEVEGTSYSNNCLFSAKLSRADRVIYSSHCNAVQDLFGCVGVNNKQYCILNKQYTKEEYEALVPRIIDKMISDGEWGEFFPASISPFGYNETVAHEYFPLTREEALKQGFYWSDYTPISPKTEKVIPGDKIPSTIEDIPDDVLNWAIKCEVTHKLFRIVGPELTFYRKHSLPLPRRHPDQRHKERMDARNPRKLSSRTCDCPTCAKDNGTADNLPLTFLTSYTPERREKVYCEKCYARIAS